MARFKDEPPTPNPGAKIPTPGLAELQNSLSTLFRAPPKGRKGAVLETIQAPAKGTRAARVEIYANAYGWRLRDAIAEDFEATRKLLGAETFNRIVADYVREFPSTSPLLGDLCERFADYLECHVLTQRRPLVIALARLEWQAVLSFYAPESSVRLESVPNVAPELWAEARFTLHPSVILHSSPWEVLDLWLQRQGDDAYTKIPKRAASENLLLHKNERWVRISRVSDIEYRVLNFMQSGLALGEILHTLETQGYSSDVAALNWQGAFERWTRDGVVIQVGFGA